MLPLWSCGLTEREHRYRHTYSDLTSFYVMPLQLLKFLLPPKRAINWTLNLQHMVFGVHVRAKPQRRMTWYRWAGQRAENRSRTGLGTSNQSINSSSPHLSLPPFFLGLCSSMCTVACLCVYHVSNTMRMQAWRHMYASVCGGQNLAFCIFLYYSPPYLSV